MAATNRQVLLAESRDQDRTRDRPETICAVQDVEHRGPTGALAVRNELIEAEVETTETQADHEHTGKEGRPGRREKRRDEFGACQRDAQQQQDIDGPEPDFPVQRFPR